MEQRSAVKNAADPKQVRAAGSVSQRRSQREDDALRQVLQTKAGRTALRAICHRAGIREGIFDHSGSVTYFKAGRQNFGFELMAWFEQLDPDNWAAADDEARLAAAQDRRTLDAAQVKSSEEKSE
jgi:hypothetical protein